MIIIYIFIIGFLVVISFIPFFAYLTIPAIYLLTLILIPIIVFYKLPISFGKKRYFISSIVFIAIYLPVFWDHIPTVIQHHCLCETEGGITKWDPWQWHQMTQPAQESLEKWRRPLRKEADRIWGEGNKRIYQDDYGFIIKTWEENGKDYTQMIDAILIEKETTKFKFVKKKVTRIIEVKNNRTLATMTNFYSSNYDEFKPWMPVGCPKSVYVYKAKGLQDSEIDIWGKWFDLLIMQYSLPYKDWRR